MRAFEIRHVVSFEDTNVVGNVYYVNHIRWQGRCRELFLRTYPPQLLERFRTGMSIVTLQCSCEYLAEVFAFDEIVVRMYLEELTPSSMTLAFEYWRMTGAEERLVARGAQKIACTQQVGGRQQPAAWPPALVAAAGAFERSTPTLT
jgi:enediyne biosynthesis thioesterase